MVMSVNRNQGAEKEHYKGKKCDYCHFLGHTKDNCYKLIGYPSDWKQRKKPGYGNGNGNMRNGTGTSQFNGYGGQSSGNNGGYGRGYQAANNISNDQYDHPSAASSNQMENNNMQKVPKGQTFTEKEYKQIMEMLNRDVQEKKQVNMAGITTCLMRNPAIQDWIVDSGATHHIIANKQLLTRRHELTKSQMNQVHLPTGDKVTVSHIGETPIFENEVARSVLHVPDFKFSLLSVSKITRELNCFVSFYPEFCVFQDLCSGRVKGIGREEEGLYSFKANFSSKQKEEIRCAQEIVVASICDFLGDCMN